MFFDSNVLWRENKKKFMDVGRWAPNGRGGDESRSTSSSCCVWRKQGILLPFVPQGPGSCGIVDFEEEEIEMCVFLWGTSETQQHLVILPLIRVPFFCFFRCFISLKVLTFSRSKKTKEKNLTRRPHRRGRWLSRTTKFIPQQIFCRDSFLRFRVLILFKIHHREWHSLSAF